MTSKAKQQRHPSLALLSLVVILVLYNAFFVTYSLQKHATFQTAGFDLGNYSQTLWHTLHGNPLTLTTMQDISSNWGIHFEPILFLIVPIYAVFTSPLTLLILQNTVVVLGAIPIFLMARKRLDGILAGFVFTCVYLLFPAIQGAIVFDFHAVVLATIFLSFALWFLANRRYHLLFIMTVLATSCKEDVPLLVLMIGIYVLLVHRQPRWGMAIIAVSVLWFGLVNFIIIPTLSPVGENIHLTRYSQWGDSMGQVIASLFFQPLNMLKFMFSGDRLRYWLRVTMPVAFIAFLDPLTLLMALPTMAINTLSSYPPNYQLDRFHYSATIVPFIVVASINGLARLVKFAAPKFKYVKPVFLQNTLLVMILLVTLIYQVQFGHTPIGRYFSWPTVTEHHRQAETILAQIPPQAAVAAQNNLVPHLSQREWIFILPKVSHQGRQADYIVMDMRSSLYPYDFIETYCAHIQEFLASPDYGLIAADDGLLLFERNTPDRATFRPMSPCP